MSRITSSKEENEFYFNFNGKSNCKRCKKEICNGIKILMIRTHYYHEHKEVYQQISNYFSMVKINENKKNPNIKKNKSNVGRKRISDENLYCSGRSSKDIINTLNQRTFREKKKRYIQMIENENKKMKKEQEELKNMIVDQQRKMINNKENSDLKKQIERLKEENRMLKDYRKRKEEEEREIELLEERMEKEIEVYDENHERGKEKISEKNNLNGIYLLEEDNLLKDNDFIEFIDFYNDKFNKDRF
jgi:hypothetical protein